MLQRRDKKWCWRRRASPAEPWWPPCWWPSSFSLCLFTVPAAEKRCGLRGTRRPPPMSKQTASVLGTTRMLTAPLFLFVCPVQCRGRSSGRRGASALQPPPLPNPGHEQRPPACSPTLSHTGEYHVQIYFIMYAQKYAFLCKFDLVWYFNMATVWTQKLFKKKV